MCHSNQTIEVSESFEVNLHQPLDIQYIPETAIQENNLPKLELTEFVNSENTHYINNESMIIENLKITNNIQSAGTTKEFCPICNIEFENMLDYHHHLQVCLFNKFYSSQVNHEMYFIFISFRRVMSLKLKYF